MFKSFQTGLKRLHHVFAVVAGGVGVAGARLERVFGGDHEMLAVGGDEFADKAFAGAVGVAIGRVDEVAAGRGIGIEHLLADFFRRAPAPVFAESHRSQGQF